MSEVLLIERSSEWCRSVNETLAEAGATSRTTAATVAAVERALADGMTNAVLVNLDLFRPSDRIEVIERLTHASVAPAVVAWAEHASVQEAFELGRLGVRHFRSTRPEPQHVVHLITRALRQRPVLEPRLRALVGHVTQSEMMRIVRDVTLDQALKMSRGNKSQAGRLLRISRQSVIKRSVDKAS